MSLIVIGLSGQRGVGKSKIADYLVEKHGFERTHPFNGGKAACRGYFTHIGISEEDAWRMTDGDLKDVPCARLPNNATPRFFMEEFGAFMGVTMGPQWTIGKELDLIEERAAREGRQPRVVMESIVYEIDYIRQRMDPLVIEVSRAQADSTIVAHKTAAAGKSVIADMVFANNGETLDQMRQGIDEVLLERFGITAEVEDLPEP